MSVWCVWVCEFVALNVYMCLGVRPSMLITKGG